MDLATLDRLSTPDLCRLAHAVARVLRERAGAEPLLIEQPDDAFCKALREAGLAGVEIQGMRAVLVKMP